MWEGSPYSDEYLEAMGESLTDSMKLGQRGSIDVLGISFSALDLVGHQYGPDSAEVQDILLQLDGTIGKLFDHLDKTVGRGNYVVAFSADHGVAPIPELALQKSMDAGRADILAVRAQVEQALAPYKLGDNPIASFQDTNLYFRPEVEEKLKANPDAMKRGDRGDQERRLELQRRFRATRWPKTRARTRWQKRRTIATTPAAAAT